MISSYLYTTLQNLVLLWKKELGEWIKYTASIHPQQGRNQYLFAKGKQRGKENWGSPLSLGESQVLGFTGKDTPNKVEEAQPPRVPHQRFGQKGSCSLGWEGLSSSWLGYPSQKLSGGGLALDGKLQPQAPGLPPAFPQPL